MHPRKLLPIALALLLAASGRHALADSYVATGALATDDSMFTYNFSATSSQTFNFFTTSYGGGANLDGTTTSAGGFVPVLTLFNGNGTINAFSATGGAADPATSLKNDAFLTETLGPGSYILELTEFPNSAIGNLSDGFLFAGQGNFTGGLCGGSGSFLETDVAPCVQRTSNYTLNVSSAAAVTPEPSTWLMVLPATGLFLVLGRRLSA